VDDFDRSYDAATSRMEDFRLVLERLIQILLEEKGIPVQVVTSRVKPRASAQRKLQRPDRNGNISSLTDLLGVRVITYFRDGVDSAARVIEREFLVDSARSVDKRAALDPDRFGYLSLHYILQLDQKRSQLAEYRTYADILFELQIRSILQHAWAEIEHDLGYKSEAEIPRTVKRRFSRLAGLLELADDEFLGIREELAVPSDGLPRSRAADLRVEVEQLLARPSHIRLPAWSREWSEAEYISRVPSSDPRFLPLDRFFIRMPSGHGSFEACDLLGPGDELIYVHRKFDSKSLGHLFNQALVSTEFLISSASTRGALAEAVERYGGGRVLATDFRPRNVVIALLSEEGPIVPIERIREFSQITLSRVAQAIEQLGANLTVVGIQQRLHTTHASRGTARPSEK
jgi:ppGpp synthetase/RelA/SpoT-type nucleotidyltranferase